MINFGHGVSLVTIEKHHLGDLWRWRNDPEIYRWCRQSDLISMAHHLNWFDQQKTDPSIKMYIIEKESIPVGVCGLTSIDMLCRRAEFSLYVDPKKHKSGYGKQALSTLLDHGFRNLGLSVIWGESFDGNPAMKLFENLGFKKEGVRRGFYWKDGKHIDAHLFSILWHEWVGRDSDRAMATGAIRTSAHTHQCRPNRPDLCSDIGFFSEAKCPPKDPEIPY